MGKVPGFGPLPLVKATHALMRELDKLGTSKVLTGSDETTVNYFADLQWKLKYGIQFDNEENKVWVKKHQKDVSWAVSGKLLEIMERLSNTHKDGRPAMQYPLLRWFIDMLECAVGQTHEITMFSDAKQNWWSKTFSTALDQRTRFEQKYPGLVAEEGLRGLELGFIIRRLLEGRQMARASWTWKVPPGALVVQTSLLSNFAMEFSELQSKAKADVQAGVDAQTQVWAAVIAIFFALLQRFIDYFWSADKSE